MQNAQASVLRTLALAASLKHAPTRSEFWQICDTNGERVSRQEVDDALMESISSGIVVEAEGRLALSVRASDIGSGRAKEISYPKKWKRALWAAKYLKSLPYVRAVCLCNTMALGQTREEGDIDFFIVCKAGSVWQTRLLSALPFAIFKLRPGAGRRDPICLSFFMTDRDLDMRKMAIKPDDPYLRHWLLNLLPLYDDGVLGEMWEANRGWLAKHCFARPWIGFYRSPLPGEKVAVIKNMENEQIKPGAFEVFCKDLQMKKFSRDIKEKMNQDTSVIVSDEMLKFHVTDRRAEYKDAYLDLCLQYGIEP